MGLDTVELIMAVEEEYNLQIPDEVLSTLTTVGELHRYIYSVVRQRPGVTATSSEVFERIREIVAEQGGIEIHRIKADSRFVDDLKMD